MYLLVKSCESFNWQGYMQIIKCALQHYTSVLSVKADCGDILIFHNIISSYRTPLTLLQVASYPSTAG